MRKKDFLIIIFIVVILMLIVFGILKYTNIINNKGQDVQNDDVIAENVDDDIDTDNIFDYQYLHLSIGETTKINYDFIGEDLGNVTYSCADESVVIVDNDGNVLGVSEGKTTITMNYNGGTLDFYVTVLDANTSNASVNNTKIHFISLTKTNGNFVACDAILLESNNKYALIDTGFSSTYQSLYSYLMKFATNGKLSLEFVLITHNHSDHMGGLIPLLSEKNINIKKIYLNKYYKNDIKASYLKLTKSENYNVYNSSQNMSYVKMNQDRYNTVIQKAKSRNVYIYYLSSSDDATYSGGGLTLALGNYSIKLYNTRQRLKSSEIDYNGFDSGDCLNDYCRNSDGNVNSIVAYVTSNVNGVKHTTLLTGDLDYPIMSDISKKVGKVDVYKMPHHGYITVSPVKKLTKSIIASIEKNSINSKTLIVATSFKSNLSNKYGFLYATQTLGKTIYCTGGDTGGKTGKTIMIDYSKQNLKIDYN